MGRGKNKSTSLSVSNSFTEWQISHIDEHLLPIGVEMITFPPTFIPSVIEYIAGGGLGEACAENNPFGLSTNSRLRSFPGGDPTLNSYG